MKKIKVGNHPAKRKKTIKHLHHYKQHPSDPPHNTVIGFGHITFTPIHDKTLERVKTFIANKGVMFQTKPASIEHYGVTRRTSVRISTDELSLVEEIQQIMGEMDIPCTPEETVQPS